MVSRSNEVRGGMNERLPFPSYRIRKIAFKIGRDEEFHGIPNPDGGCSIGPMDCDAVCRLVTKIQGVDSLVRPKYLVAPLVLRTRTKPQDLENSPGYY